MEHPAIHFGMLPIIGLDFGNCFSYASTMWQNEDIRNLNPEQFAYGIPSTFTYVNGTEYKCYPALDSSLNELYPDANLFKRHFACGDSTVNFGDVSLKTSYIIGRLITHVLNTANQYLFIQCNIRTNKVLMCYPETYNPETICAYKKLVESLEIDMGDGHTEKASVVGMISESTAAAYDFMRERNISEEETILVTDLGGGTYDLTVLTANPKGILTDNRKVFSSVVQHDGIDKLGGHDFTMVMYGILMGKVNEQNPNARVQEGSVRKSAELAKRDLTFAQKATVVDIICLEGGVILPFEVTREEFAAACRGEGKYKEFLRDENGNIRNLINEIMDITKSIFQSAIDDGYKIDRIVCVGGATQMPVVQEEFKKQFSAYFRNVDDAIVFHNASKAISHGATRYAVDIPNLPEPGEEQDEPEEDKPIAPIRFTLRRDLAVSTFKNGMVPLAKANTALPYEHMSTFTTHGETDHVDCSLYQAESQNPSGIGDYRRILDFNYPFPRPVRPRTPIKIRLNIDENGLATMTVIDNKGEQKTMKRSLVNIS